MLIERLTYHSVFKVFHNIPFINPKPWKPNKKHQYITIYNAKKPSSLYNYTAQVLNRLSSEKKDRIKGEKTEYKNENQKKKKMKSECLNKALFKQHGLCLEGDFTWACSNDKSTG